MTSLTDAWDDWHNWVGVTRASSNFGDTETSRMIMILLSAGNSRLEISRKIAIKSEMGFGDVGAIVDFHRELIASGRKMQYLSHNATPPDLELPIVEIIFDWQRYIRSAYHTGWSDTQLRAILSCLYFYPTQDIEMIVKLYGTDKVDFDVALRECCHRLNRFTQTGKKLEDTYNPYSTIVRNATPSIDHSDILNRTPESNYYTDKQIADLTYKALNEGHSLGEICYEMVRHQSMLISHEMFTMSIDSETQLRAHIDNTVEHTLTNFIGGGSGYTPSVRAHVEQLLHATLNRIDGVSSVGSIDVDYNVITNSLEAQVEYQLEPSAPIRISNTSRGLLDSSMENMLDGITAQAGEVSSLGSSGIRELMGDMFRQLPDRYRNGLNSPIHVAIPTDLGREVAVEISDEGTVASVNNTPRRAEGYLDNFGEDAGDILDRQTREAMLADEEVSPSIHVVERSELAGTASQTQKKPMEWGDWLEI